MLTAPQLFAAAVGAPCPTGPERCFYCGGACDRTFPAAAHRSDGFTGWAEARGDTNGYVCGGCVAATDEADRSKRPRFFSWVVTAGGATPYAKGDLAGLRAACLAPPEPPYAIVVAVSGQKHLLYRLDQVNRTRDPVTVQLELERVTYRPAELRRRLNLCARVAAACGSKQALARAPDGGTAAQIGLYWADPTPLLDWFDVWAEPLSRLAAHLTPPSEECRREFPSDRPAPAPAGTDRRRRPGPDGRPAAA